MLTTDILQTVASKNELTDKLVDFPNSLINHFVNDFMKTEKENQLKFECKILPYSELKCGKELFRCPLCNVDGIEGRKELTEHLHQHQLQFRSTEGKHLCCLCGKELSSNSSLERHLLTHSNHRPFDCSVCGKKFTTNGNLSRHIKASHSGTNCCSASLSTSSPLTINTVSNFKSSPSISPLKPPIFGFTSSEFQTTPIDMVQIMNFDAFPSQNLLLKFFEQSIHNLQFFKEPSPTVNDEVLNLSVKSNKQNEMNDSLLCEFSGRLSNKFDDISSQPLAKRISQKYREKRNNRFLKQQKEITDDLPLDLSMRKGSFKEQTNSFLSSSDSCEYDHSPIRSEPSKTGSKECSHHALKIKKNSYKDAPKLIRCPVFGCTQKFPWNSSLMRHILTHTEHKPFKCIRCAKCFSTKSNRERHMHRVHGIRMNKYRYKSMVYNDFSTLDSSVNDYDFVDVTKNDFLSEQEWMEMSSSDRQAEDISHSLLKEAGEPVIEPNPYRKYSSNKLFGI